MRLQGFRACSWTWPFPPESAACSNQTWISIRANTVKRTAVQLIRRSLWRWPRGSKLGSLIGGCRSAVHGWNGAVGYEARMASSGGLGPLICVLRVAWAVT